MKKSEYTKKIALWATMFTFVVAGFAAMLLWRLFSGSVELDYNFAIAVFCAIGSFFTGGKLIDTVNAYDAYKKEVKRCEKLWKERERQFPWEEWNEEH